MDSNKLVSFVDGFWKKSAIPALSEFIKIPSKNAAYDTDWQNNKYLEKTANLIGEWICAQGIPNTKMEVLNLEGRTPFLYVEIAGDPSVNKTVLFYGHLDKMPESEGWTNGRGPWTPVLEGDFLYGRASADNGSSTFITLAALKGLQDQSIPHARCVFLLECGEENGSPDFLSYLPILEKRIGTPDFMVCLDAGGDDFEHLWITNSTRGSVNVTVSVEMLKQAVHSGTFGGMAASTLRIMRQLIARIEDADTGKLLLPELNVDIPQEWQIALKEAGTAIGKSIFDTIPLLAGCSAVSSDPVVMLQKQTWESAMEVTGANGFPLIENAGNVVRPATVFLFNFRLPPTADTKKAVAALKKAFESNPPYGAKIEFKVKSECAGWVMGGSDGWLKKAVADASATYFGKKPIYRGEGGAITPLSILSNKFPQAPFLVTGVLCAGAGTHGPDEFLHLPLAKKTSCVMAHILAEHFKHS